MVGLVVVGVDGSKESRKALSWAAQDARRRGAELRVVYVYEERLGASLFEDSYVRTLRPRQVDRMALEEHRWREHHQLAEVLEAEELLVELVEDLPAELREVPIERSVRESSRPARVLLEEARNADLLVVGSRGCGGFTGLPLGSVSQQLAQYAPCPVVIVHNEDVALDLSDG